MVEEERRSHSRSHSHSRSKDAELEAGVEDVVVASSYSSLALASYHNTIDDAGVEKSLVACYPVDSCEGSQHSHSSAQCLCLCYCYLASLQTMALLDAAGTLADSL